VKDTEANEQHKSIISALKAAAAEWEFEQINFVVGNLGSVVESDLYTKLKKLDIQEGKKDKLFADHVTKVCEAHNRVSVSFLQQVQRGTRPTTEGSRESARRYEANYRGIEGTMCTCEEIERETHACKASKLGPVGRWWTQDGKMGITTLEPPKSLEDGQIYCILLIRIAFCHMSGHFAACFTIL